MKVTRQNAHASQALVGLNVKVCQEDFGHFLLSECKIMVLCLQLLLRDKGDLYRKNNNTKR